MTRILTVFNLTGVLVLVGLGVTQWKQNGQLHRDLTASEKVRAAQEQELADQTRQIAGLGADLEEFRGRFSLAESQLKEAQTQLKESQAALTRTTVERDQLRNAVDKWREAVTQRDAVIQKAKEQIATLVTERNGAVAKFNDLALKYNHLATMPSR